MTLNEIAAELVAGCREERERANLETLYAPDAVSVEAMDFGDGREVQGLDGIRGKHDWFDGMYEVLEHSASDPMPHGDDRFAVVFTAKTKERESGKIEDMNEVAVYHVAGGKITREEFFYGA